MKWRLVSSLPLLFLLLCCKPSNQELMDKADALADAKKYDEAIAIYTKILEEDSRFQRPRHNGGICVKDQGTAQ